MVSSSYWLQETFICWEYTKSKMNCKEFKAEEKCEIKRYPIYANSSTDQLNKHPEMKASVKKEYNESYLSEIKYSKITRFNDVSAEEAKSSVSLLVPYAVKQEENSNYSELKLDAKLTPFQKSLPFQEKIGTVVSPKTNFKTDENEHYLQKCEGEGER